MGQVKKEGVVDSRLGRRNGFPTPETKPHQPHHHHNGHVRAGHLIRVTSFVFYSTLGNIPSVLQMRSPSLGEVTAHDHTIIVTSHLTVFEPGSMWAFYPLPTIDHRRGLELRMSVSELQNGIFDHIYAGRMEQSIGWSNENPRFLKCRMTAETKLTNSSFSWAVLHPWLEGVGV